MPAADRKGSALGKPSASSRPGEVTISAPDVSRGVNPESSPPSPLEKLKWIADQAARVASTIERFFPLAGRKWLDAQHPIKEELITAVGESFARLEFLINPNCLPFEHPNRRNPDLVAGGFVSARMEIAVALKSVLLTYDRLLQHYEVQDIISEGSEPPVFWRWDGIPMVNPEMVEDLAQAGARLMAVVNESDCELLLEMLGQQDVKPSWDDLAGQLWYGSICCLELAKKARQSRVVLQAFHEEGWPPSIDDPLDPGKLPDTIKNLQRKMRNKPISFAGDGTGRGIRWFVNPPS